MVETVLALPLVLAACAFVVEVARVAAVLLVLEVGVHDLAEDLALRWLALERDGLVLDAAPGNASDLRPDLHAALTEALLAHVGGFPGSSPVASTREPLSGRVFVDLRGNGELRVEARVCVPLSFLPRSWWQRDGVGRIRGSSPPGDRTGDGALRRDCEGRFLASAPAPSFVLWAETSVPLPASYYVHAKGLALPPRVPLVNVPSPGASLFGRAAPRPRWDRLFVDAADLYREQGTGGSRSAAAPPSVRREAK